MSNDTNQAPELPIFPTSAPEVFSDPAAATKLFESVLERLADVVDISPQNYSAPTPCSEYDAGHLLAHVLGWLEFFAAALSDPEAVSPRPDPNTFALSSDATPGELVNRALSDIRRAIAAGVASHIVTMSSARMAGDGVLAMALGEYIVHGWDLATTTGKDYDAPADAIDAAHQFLLSTVAPEYRGPDSGFYGHEVQVADDASHLETLLGFAGRDPQWRGPTPN